MQNDALGIELDAIEGKKEGRSKSAFCLRNKISISGNGRHKMPDDEKREAAADRCSQTEKWLAMPYDMPAEQGD
jgi:hypothetical protein